MSNAKALVFYRNYKKKLGFFVRLSIFIFNFQNMNKHPHTFRCLTYYGVCTIFFSNTFW